MEKKFLSFALTVLMASTLQVKDQHAKKDSTFKRWFAGSSFLRLDCQIN